MSRLSGTRLQTALVVILFVASLAVLLLNGAWPLLLPRRELRAREALREASRRLAEGAAPLAGALDGDGAPPSEGALRRLRQVTERALADSPGAEGGFYLGAADRFAGYAFPTAVSPPEPLPNPRDDPPPKEAPVIRGLARQSLDLAPGEVLASVQDVGPSRVAFVTEPVGDRRPAPLAAWVMFRVTRPEEAEARLPGYVASSALALSGIAVALWLSGNLGRSLRRQRAEQERLREELRRAEHLAALGRLLAGVAHEVRNPLAAIRSTVQLWQRLPDAAHTPASLEAMLGAVDRLNAIVGRLLYFSRADNAERRPVAVNHLLGETLDLLSAQAEGQRVALERDFAPNLPPALGSANALRQVALNLFANALQAMPHGGRLCCATCYDPKAGTVTVRVSDTGPGVGAADRGHLFEPFFTTRPEGTGLGLALCREIVASHGGTIALDEAAGPGATFVVSLPAFAPDPREPLP